MTPAVEAAAAAATAVCVLALTVVGACLVTGWWL